MQDNFKKFVKTVGGKIVVVALVLTVTCVVQSQLFGKVPVANAAQIFQSTQDTIDIARVNTVNDMLFGGVAAYHRIDPDYDDDKDKAVSKFQVFIAHRLNLRKLKI